MAQKKKTKTRPEAPTEKVEHDGRSFVTKWAEACGKDKDVGPGAKGVEIRLRGVIPSGIMGIDRAIGRGGVPLGRLSVITGAESCGKTTLALHLATQVQQMGGLVSYFDMERKLDIDYAAALGVNVDDMDIRKPEYLEKALGVMDRVIQKARDVGGDEVPVLVIFDSINAAVPKVEWEKKDYEDDAVMAAQARVWSRYLPKLMARSMPAATSIVLISQVRDKMTRFGSKRETVAGGHAVKHYATVVMEVIRLETLKDKTDPIGMKTKFLVSKNQVSRPFGEAELHLVWGKGFDATDSLLEESVLKGFVYRGTVGWHEVPDDVGELHKFQGVVGFKKLLAEKPEIEAMLYAKHREAACGAVL